MSIDGFVANQVRLIMDSAGRILGYKNPVTSVDEAVVPVPAATAAAAEAAFARPSPIVADRVFSAADDGKSFDVLVTCTLTLPAGLTWEQGVSLRIAPSITASVACSGTTLNNAGTTLTRTLADNYATAGIVMLLPGLAPNTYGLTGA